MIKTVNFYCNNKNVAEVTELKNKWSEWKKVKTAHLSPNEIEIRVDFPIPITARNFLIEYTAFYENLQASVEKLICPRCSRPVTDKHGFCKHCHESAFQCRHCRNINYENLNGFLCNECGYSKFGSFNYTYFCKPSFSSYPITNDEELKKAMKTIDKESENAYKRYQQLRDYRKPISRIIGSISASEETKEDLLSLPSGKISRKITLLAIMYGKECKKCF